MKIGDTPEEASCIPFMKVISNVTGRICQQGSAGAGSGLLCGRTRSREIALEIWLPASGKDYTALNT